MDYGDYNRYIFGLRVKQLRVEKGFSFSEMSAASGLSISYLNEIEKGKKYPKDEKIKALAAALGVAPEALTAASLDDRLAPVGELLRSNFLKELPLDFFGIELADVLEMLAKAPKQVGAFIRTLVELSENYPLREEHFYLGALRSYLEMHYNYFEDLEEAVERFRAKYLEPGLPEEGQLADILQQVYQYNLVPDGLAAYPELSGLRSVFLEEGRRLLLNRKLSAAQRTFQYGKELGFQYLGLTTRAYTSSLLRITTFEEVLNHFKASYFSAALLIPASTFLDDIRDFFGRPVWDPRRLQELMEKYQASPEMIFQRMSNLLPREFGWRDIFLLRVVHSEEDGRIRLDKELRLGGKRLPALREGESNCRRWLPVGLLEQFIRRSNQAEPLIAAQRARHIETGESYLCLTVARSSHPDQGRCISITLGIGNPQPFVEDVTIPSAEIHQSCQRCLMENCAERQSPPILARAREKRRRVLEALKKISGSPLP